MANQSDIAILEHLESYMNFLNIQIVAYSAPFIIKINGQDYCIVDKDNNKNVTKLPRAYNSEVLVTDD